MALTDNLISVWHMNNNLQDSIGTNHGTAYGATFSTSAKLGSHAGNFDGIDDYVLVKSGTIVFKLANHSLSMWVYVTDLTTRVTMYSEDVSAGSYAAITIFPDGRVGFYLQSGGVYEANTVAGIAQTNTWHHIVCTFGSGGMKVFVDGIYRANHANTNPVTVEITSAYIGRMTSGLWFKGRKDELALWSKTLTDGGVALNQTAAGEVAELHNSGAGIEIWRFLKGVNLAPKVIQTVTRPKVIQVTGKPKAIQSTNPFKAVVK